MNPNNNPLYRYQFKHLQEKSKYDHNSNYDNGWKTIIALGIAIASVTFYNNVKRESKLIHKVVQHYDSINKVKTDTLEYKIKWEKKSLKKEQQKNMKIE